MDESLHDKVDRRKFLQLAATTMTASGMVTSCQNSAGRFKVIEPTAAQLAHKRSTDSPLAIVHCSEYTDDIFQQCKSYLKDLDLPELNNKTVLIKPNMVDVNQGKPLTTHPLMVRAAIELANHLGAKQIIVGDGPAHERDSDYLLESTGIGKICRSMGVPFIDLNLDDLEKVSNADGFSKVSDIYLPKTAVTADAIISLPKLKTHHWARMTASMKNLFGVVPGRKYGWPKNLLHCRGIDNFVLDLTMLLRPAIQFVDAIVAMEGDGPLNGTARNSDFVALGTDPAAVDATCARAMGLDPHKIPYLRVSGLVIGNIDPDHIKIVGADLAQVTQTFELPPNFKNGAQFGDATAAGS